LVKVVPLIRPPDLAAPFVRDAAVGEFAREVGFLSLGDLLGDGLFVSFDG
jgi:hypothetical protein